jgi:hypothetical protein
VYLRNPFCDSEEALIMALATVTAEMDLYLAGSKKSIFG